MTRLSPAAQAVLHGFWDAPVSPSRNCQIAAALRTAVEQCIVVRSGTDTRCVRISELLAIATELEDPE